MTTSVLRKNTLVIFGSKLPVKLIRQGVFDVIIAEQKFKEVIEAYGVEFVDVATLTDTGSLDEAGAMLEELPHIQLSENHKVAEAFVYYGHKLWWSHYGDMQHHFCIPYTQYRRLLEYVRESKKVSLYHPLFEGLFTAYLQAFGCDVSVHWGVGRRFAHIVPSGILLQVLLSFLSIIVLMFRRRQLMLFIGDKFEEGKDYDFRLKFLYEELRRRKVPFMEVIRSLESWNIVLQHALKRKRPVIYFEAIKYVARIVSIVTGGRIRARRQFTHQCSFEIQNAETQFMYSIATWYLREIYDDVWTIRIMKTLLKFGGICSAFIPSMNERNFQVGIGCKLNGIQTVGIMHGVPSPNISPNDFFPLSDDDRKLSVDVYGLWSEWWRKYYMQFSGSYNQHQLYVSGPMRPLTKMTTERQNHETEQGKIRVLIISEQVGNPQENLQYLRELLAQEDFSCTIKFRPYRDGFEEWMQLHEPALLEDKRLLIERGTVQQAVQNADVVIGSFSTAVLEALLQLKIPIFFRTRKWGDYFRMTNEAKTQCLFAENPKELVERIRYSNQVSKELLVELCEQYFGNPHKNGSAWVVDMLIEGLEKHKHIQ